MRFFYSFIDDEFSRARLREARTLAQQALPDLDLAEDRGHVQIVDVNADGLPDLFSTSPEGLVGIQKVCLNQGPDAEGHIRFSPAITASYPCRYVG